MDALQLRIRIPAFDMQSDVWTIDEQDEDAIE